MSPARRSIKRRDWPRGLYEPRPGYYVWREPGGKTHTIGKVPFLVARNEALLANQHVADTKPNLVQRLVGGAHTVAELQAELPEPASAASAKSYRAWDKVIREKLGAKLCGSLTVADCAEVIEPYRKAGKLHTVQQLRGRLMVMCRRGMALGWMESNPAELTDDATPEVKRQRLSLKQFQAILARAPEVAGWLPHAMLLALITGQDRSTVSAMERSHVRDGALIVWRRKTRKSNAPIAIPLELRMDAIGMTLGELVAELVARKIGAGGKHLVQHTRTHSITKAGSQVSPASISIAFAKARDLAKVGGTNPPSFHEIRSLSKRLYLQQGGVDTKTLLGHKSDSAAAVYEDPRSAEPVRVRLTDVNAK